MIPKPAKPIHDLEADEIDLYVERVFVQFLKWSHTPELPDLPAALQSQVSLLNTVKAFWPAKTQRIDSLVNAMSTLKEFIERKERAAPRS